MNHEVAATRSPTRHKDSSPALLRASAELGQNGANLRRQQSTRASSPLPVLKGGAERRGMIQSRELALQQATDPPFRQTGQTNDGTFPAFETTIEPSTVQRLAPVPPKPQPQPPRGGTQFGPTGPASCPRPASNPVATSPRTAKKSNGPVTRVRRSSGTESDSRTIVCCVVPFRRPSGSSSTSWRDSPSVGRPRPASF